VSKASGEFTSPNHLEFHEPFSYIYDNLSHMLYIEIFRMHEYLDNSDLEEVLNAAIDLSDITNVNGDYI
jgi:hypothetical protein